MTRGKIIATKDGQRKTVPFYDLSSLDAGRTQLHREGTTEVDYVTLSYSERSERDRIDRLYRLDEARSRVRLDDQP